MPFYFRWDNKSGGNKRSKHKFSPDESPIKESLKRWAKWNAANWSQKKAGNTKADYPLKKGWERSIFHQISEVFMKAFLLIKTKMKVLETILVMVPSCCICRV